MPFFVPLSWLMNGHFDELSLQCCIAVITDTSVCLRSVDASH